MIVCPECKHKIQSRSHFCPLCGGSFVDNGVDEKTINGTIRRYAPRQKLSILAYSVFNSVYIGLAVPISILALLLEGFIAGWNIKYAYIVMSVLFYLYMLLRLVNNDLKYFPQKILSQALILSLIGFFISRPFGAEEEFFSFAAPSIFLISLVTVSIYVFINYRRPEKHAANIIFMAVIAVIPFILTVIMKAEHVIYPLVVACIGGGFVILSLAFFGRRIAQEIKSIFHI